MNLDTKDLNILERISIYMGKRQMVDNIIFLILLLGFIVSGLFIGDDEHLRGAWAIIISVMVAIVVGSSRRWIYKNLL